MFNIFEYQYFVLPYEQYVYIAIGLGMVLSLLLSESLGVVAGGIIVPGYIALHLQDLPSIFLTFFISFVTYLIIYLLSKNFLRVLIFEGDSTIISGLFITAII